MTRLPTRHWWTTTILACQALLAGCAVAAPESSLRAEIDRNRTLWLGVAPAAYEFSLERQCFCGREARGPVHMEVDGGRIVSMRYVDDGTPVDSSFVPLFPAVLGLFEELEQALDLGAHDIDVTWDESTGVPLDLFIDFDRSVADEEYGFRVTELPAPLSGS